MCMTSEGCILDNYYSLVDVPPPPPLRRHRYVGESPQKVPRCNDIHGLVFVFQELTPDLCTTHHRPAPLNKCCL